MHHSRTLFILLHYWKKTKFIIHSLALCVWVWNESINQCILLLVKNTVLLRDISAIPYLEANKQAIFLFYLDGHIKSFKYTIINSWPATYIRYKSLSFLCKLWFQFAYIVLINYCNCNYCTPSFPLDQTHSYTGGDRRWNQYIEQWKDEEN